MFITYDILTPDDGILKNLYGPGVRNHTVVEILNPLPTFIASCKDEEMFREFQIKSFHDIFNLRNVMSCEVISLEIVMRKNGRYLFKKVAEVYERLDGFMHVYILGDGSRYCRIDEEVEMLRGDYQLVFKSPSLDAN